MHRPKHKMPVVAHYAITTKTHLKAFDSFAEYPLERLKVQVFFENPQPTVRTIQNVINNISLCDSSSSRHNCHY